MARKRKLLFNQALYESNGRKLKEEYQQIFKIHSEYIKSILNENIRYVWNRMIRVSVDQMNWSLG